MNHEICLTCPLKRCVEDEIGRRRVELTQQCPLRAAQMAEIPKAPRDDAAIEKRRRYQREWEQTPKRKAYRAAYAKSDKRRTYERAYKAQMRAAQRESDANQ